VQRHAGRHAARARHRDVHIYAARRLTRLATAPRRRCVVAASAAACWHASTAGDVQQRSQLLMLHVFAAQRTPAASVTRPRPTQCADFQVHSSSSSRLDTLPAPTTHVPHPRRQPHASASAAPAGVRPCACKRGSVHCQAAHAEPHAVCPASTQRAKAQQALARLLAHAGPALP
jgi:hypothetical protein